MSHSFDRDYWRQQWGGGRAAAMATGPANPHLVRETAALTPGTALDAGCGGGAEALWLADRGWEVTAVDVADEALAAAAQRAAHSDHGDRVRWVLADLSTWQPPQRYDLVTTHYAHPAMPQLEFYELISSWVAPGGSLLIVGHLHAHGHGPGTGPGHRLEHGHRDGPPAEATVTAAEVTGRLDPARWEVVTAEESQRGVTGPDGRTVALHDVVVRAVRYR